MQFAPLILIRPQLKRLFRRRPKVLDKFFMPSLENYFTKFEQVLIKSREARAEPKNVIVAHENY